MLVEVNVDEREELDNAEVGKESRQSKTPKPTRSRRGRVGREEVVAVAVLGRCLLKSRPNDLR